jgi:hypothetical protein
MRASNERDLLGRLLECHDRIRGRLADGSAIATQASSPEEAHATAERIGRYFTRGLLLHTRDEEESIIPRLTALEAPELASALDRMHDEHVEQEALVNSLVSACRGLVDAPLECWKEFLPAIASAADALAPLMLVHLDEEERAVFPQLGLLGADGQAQILDEIDSRRDR